MLYQFDSCIKTNQVSNKTGCLKTNEFTATVATLPLTNWTTGIAPAIQLETDPTKNISIRV